MDRDPQILKIDGKSELVVMTMADYRRLREAAEDAQDIRAIRAARKADHGKPTYTIDEVRTRLGIVKKAANKKKNRNVRRKS